MEKTKLLIVDDDLGVLKQLKWALDNDYEVLTASTKDDAVDSFNEHLPDIIALDVNLSGVEVLAKQGIELLEEIKTKAPFTKVIMITGNDTKTVAMEAIEKGAFDYYLKPIDVDELKVILKRAVYIQRLEKDNLRLSRQLDDHIKFEDMIGTSEQMQGVFKLIRRVSPTDATVLVTGDSGTGKELVARAIHCLSARKDNPFIVINCGAIPENLLESELFGHEKGSFTDAHNKRLGKLETADKGTVFLDEIGEMSLGLQVKILRFLQERVIERVGGNESIELDVRIIAATNCDLQKNIKKGLFREDLFYRLSVINIALPALKDRGDDILLLSNYFLNKYTSEGLKTSVKGFSKEAKDVLRRYSWPGNVREMENKIRRAMIMAENSLISPDELGFSNNESADNLSSGKLSLKDARQEIEVKYIKKALEENKGNVSQAAKMLDITRPTLYDLMKKYNIS